MPIAELIRSRQNPYFKAGLALHQRKHRVAMGQLLVVGEKAIKEAQAAGLPLERVFIREDVLVSANTFAPTLPYHPLTEALLKTLAETDSAPSMVAVMSLPQQAQLQSAEELPRPIEPQERLLVLDGVQDPGNMGTLLRSAVAFGVKRVLVLEPAVDVWSPKVIRSSIGLQFRLQLQSYRPPTTAEALHALTSQGWHLYLADAFEDGHAQGQYLHEFKPSATQGLALVLGQEGQGLRLSASEKKTFPVLSVAMTDVAESLNVGVTGSLMLHHFFSATVKGASHGS